MSYFKSETGTSKRLADEFALRIVGRKLDELEYGYLELLITNYLSGRPGDDYRSWIRRRDVFEAEFREEIAFLYGSSQD